jgi:DtxR family transcriptional regulator, Mn-dependent transcriptional regulator
MPSEATEMYLLTIFRLTDGAASASVKDIAQRLEVHHSSAYEKVRRLSDQGYVTHHESEGGVVLTPVGRRIAVNLMRKHRLLKAFLVQMAGYQLDEVYDEACRLEHAISDRLADRLEAMLGYPEVDPHGYPIPAKDGAIPEVHYRSLNDYPAGSTVIVRRIDALNQEKLKYLNELGLVPGSTVTVETIAPFDGPLTLRLGSRQVVIAPSLAQEIDVSRQQESPAAGS